MGESVYPNCQEAKGRKREVDNITWSERESKQTEKSLDAESERWPMSL